MQHNVLIRDDTCGQWLSFSQPQQIYVTHDLDNILSLLQQIEQDVRQKGLWAAGWLSFEASPAFDKALLTHHCSGFPLLWFGLFKHCEQLDLHPLITAKHVNVFQETVWSLNSDLQSYRKKIHRIKNEIKNGNTYQVNYTIRQYADIDISAQDVFLGFAANARYGAYIDSGRYAICCASPELFFNIDRHQFSSRPMKGTAPRGRFVAEDNALKQELYHSEKNRAENLMIVDMIRNDVGRIAKTGSVKVPKLFDIEKYPTVWQMTSTVTAEVHAPLAQLFKALFPCASITGAPKANTMSIINKLEPSARNIYTGSIGFIRPDMSMQFNVAIRTALIDKYYNQAEYGVGGGIVWDSKADSEYQECLTKSKVLSGQGTFTHQLLETLLWTPDEGYFLLDYHLQRLQDSAEYFDYPLDLEELKHTLDEVVVNQDHPQRVRVTISSQGRVEIAKIAFSPMADSHIYRVKLACEPIDKKNVYLYHKTTQRSVYDYYKQMYPDYDDVLLINKDDEVTESCIANIIVQIDNTRYTPPVDCGLLNGTYRQFLIDQGELVERVISRQMLETSEQLYLINSVRKMWPIELDW